MEITFNEVKSNITVVNDKTPDGLPTIEKQLNDIKIADEELNTVNKEQTDKIYRREMIQRVKCLCLLKMNKSIYTNTLSLKPKERDNLQKLMYEYNDIEHKDIIKEFNEKICDAIDNNEIDLSKVPIYQYK